MENLENFDINDFQIKQKVDNQDLLVCLDNNNQGFKTPASQFNNQSVGNITETAYQVESFHPLIESESIGYYIKIGKLIIFRGKAVIQGELVANSFILLPFNYSQMNTNKSINVTFAMTLEDSPNECRDPYFDNGNTFFTGLCGVSGRAGYFFFSGYFFID